ncbi:segregation and condensation protein A [Pedobacter sp. UYEF25]
MQTDSFEIKIPVFEGPFDLLLFFIERDELNIHEVEIAKITADFLAYIHELLALNVEIASEFILVAATLMRIKSKMLLPRLALNTDESEINSEDDLIARLMAYKQFKDAAERLKHLETERALRAKRGNIDADLTSASASMSHKDELFSLNLFRLLGVYRRSIEKHTLRVAEIKHTVVQYPYSVEQQKYVIKNLVNINKELDFALLLRNSENKVQFVYNFLAILEMLQQQLLILKVGAGYNNFKLSQAE